jgi:hypothetical protein
MRQRELYWRNATVQYACVRAFLIVSVLQYQIVQIKCSFFFNTATVKLNRWRGTV